MRKAIIVQLKTIQEFGNRVKQTFMAPENYATPYCTVKMLSDMKSYNNNYGSFLEFEVYIYVSDSFLTLDDLVKKVKNVLSVTLMTDDSPARFFTPELITVQSDFFDDIKKLFIKRIDFRIPKYRY
jgi:hypothetical protein